MRNTKLERHEEWPVEVIRSKRRRKTISAAVKNGTLVVRAPATISEEALAPIVEKLRRRLQKKTRSVPATDADLEKLAGKLNKQYFKNQLRWQSIRFVTNQSKRFGSCTPSQGTIRISHRVAEMPAWVKRYVVMHELAHLQEANHGPKFWRLVNQDPLAERARGYLMAIGIEDESAD